MCSAMGAAAYLIIFPFNGAVGNIGTGLEGINKSFSHPILKTVGVVFARTLQEVSAVVSLIIIGSLLSSNPAVLIATLTFGLAAVLSPAVNALIQAYSENVGLKITFKAIDMGMDFASKAINVASIGFGLMALTQPIIYIPSILALTALNGYVFLK